MTQRSKLGTFTSGAKVYDYLLNYPCVVDWIESYESKFTRDQYLRTFHLFVEFCELSPDKLVKLSPVEAKKRLVSLSRKFRDEEKHAWALAIIKSVKSFYGHYGVELKLRRTEKIRPLRKRIDYEVIPQKEQVYKMVDSTSTLRNKAVILCFFQSGVRIGCLINWPFSLVKDQLFPTVKIPIRLKITENIDTKLRSYGLRYYYTFLEKEAAEALHDYLQWRMNNGEKLTDNSSVFVSHSTTVSGEQLKAGSIRTMIKRCVKAIGLNPKTVWPHCLKKAFRKVLNSSPIDEDTKEAIMGHKIPGSRENYFDRHDIGEIEQKYMKCNFSRETSTMKTEDMEKLAKLKALEMMCGVLPVPMSREDAIKAKEKELERPLTTDEKIEVLQELSLQGVRRLGNNVANDCETKLITEDELCDYLNDGWEFARELRSGKILVRKR